MTSAIVAIGESVVEVFMLSQVRLIIIGVVAEGGVDFVLAVVGAVAVGDRRRRSPSPSTTIAEEEGEDETSETELFPTRGCGGGAESVAAAAVVMEEAGGRREF